VPNRFITFEVHDVIDADPLGNEPLFDGAGNLVGRATAGSYGATVGKSLGLGYIKPAFASVGTGIEIEILGERKRATVLIDSPYDPQNSDLKG
jgi:dimethylglycine dehydrogenase